MSGRGGARGRAGCGGGLALLASLALALAAPAAAELLRCQGPDGSTIFTDDPARCPGAKPFVPEAILQPGGSGAPAGAPPSGVAPAAVDRSEARARAADAERAEARRWAGKKRAAEQELAHIGERRAYLRSFVTHCNRGGDVLTRDEAGIKRTVSCDALRETFEDLDAREAELQAYLRDGLAEECRRAGCLPGWIR